MMILRLRPFSALNMACGYCTVSIIVALAAASSPYFVFGDNGAQTYQFGYDTRPSPDKEQAVPRLMREESRLEDGTVVGRYGYTDPFGVFRVVKYVAGPSGYYAFEDIGGASSSHIPLFFRATARQKEEQARQAATSTGRSGLLPDKFNPPLYHPEAHEASESAEEAEEAEAPEQDGPVAADEREGPEYVHELDQDVHHPDVHEIDQVDQLQPPGQSDSQPETTLAPKRSTQASDTKVTFDDDLETVSRSPFEDDEDIIKILESVRVTDTAHGDLAHSSDKPTSTEKPQASLEDVLTVLRLFPKSNGGVPRDRLSVATTALANLAQWTTEGPTARMATAELSTTTETPTTEVHSTETTAYPTPTNELTVSTPTPATEATTATPVPTESAQTTATSPETTMSSTAHTETNSAPVVAAISTQLSSTEIFTTEMPTTDITAATEEVATSTTSVAETTTQDMTTTEMPGDQVPLTTESVPTETLTTDMPLEELLTTEMPTTAAPIPTTEITSTAQPETETASPVEAIKTTEVFPTETPTTVEPTTSTEIPATESLTTVETMPTTLTPSTEPPATANHTSETTVAATETTEAQTSQVVTTLSPTHASISSLDNDAYRHEGSFQSVIFALQRRRSKAPPKVNRAPDSPMTTEAPEVLVTTPDIATTSTTSSTQVFKMRNDLSLRPRKRLVRVMKVKPNRRWSSMRPSFRTDRVQIHETDYNLKKIVFVLSAH